MDLIKALKEIRAFIFERDGLNKDPESMLTELSQNTNVEVDLLTIFYNLFGNLKTEMDKKGIETVGKRNWMQPEKEILMMFMGERERTGLVFEEARDQLAKILEREPLGVQYQYYTIGKKLKNNSKPKNKKDSNTNKNKSDSATARNNVTEIKNTKNTEKDYEDIETVKDNNLFRDLNERRANESTYNPETTTTNKKNKKERNLFKLLGGLTNNIQVLENSETDNSSSERIFEMLDGLHELSAIAAENSYKSAKYEDVERKLNSKQKQLEDLEKEYKNLYNSYKELASVVQDFQNWDDMKIIRELDKFHNMVNFKIEQSGVIVEKKTRNIKIDGRGQVVGIN